MFPVCNNPKCHERLVMTVSHNIVSCSNCNKKMLLSKAISGVRTTMQLESNKITHEVRLTSAQLKGFLGNDLEEAEPDSIVKKLVLLEVHNFPVMSNHLVTIQTHIKQIDIGTNWH